MTRHLRCLLILAFLLLAPAATAGADPAGARPSRPTPVWFPPDSSGWPGGWLDATHVSPWLAFHKARAARAAGAPRATATPNQQAWDATAYDLDLTPDPALAVLSGVVRVRANVVAGPLSQVELDLDDAMAVDQVYSAGSPAPFAHAGGELTVTLERPYGTGEAFDLTVVYHGTPAGGAFGTAFSFVTHNGQPLLYTVSEPFGARTWWPCKDAPEDKADSVSLRVTVPAGMTTVCNGALVSATGDAQHVTTLWKERHPIATYLVSLASFGYTHSRDYYLASPTDSMPIDFYEFPESVPYNAPVDAKVKGMIAAFAAHFGPYPFLDEKYGMAQCLFGGGMENQTVTSIGPFYEWVVAHELSHQWWGDRVTCRDFHHVWLNEGFATFCEALWSEAQDGAWAYHDDMIGSRYFGPGTVWVPSESDPSRIFDSNLSYDKGAWVLHMLRHVMGDTLFFQALRAYGDRHAGGTAVTEDLRDVCAELSGRNLDRYFDEWVYGEYYPQYRAGWAAAPAGGGYDVSVTIEQIQTWQLFWMPVDVAVTTAAGTQTFTAWDSLPAQTFTFHVDQPPSAVAIDPDEWILRKVTAPTGEVAPGPAAGRLELATPRPNPTRGVTQLAFTLPRAGTARLSIVDVTGARVWRREETLAAGDHQWAWDARDASGRPVSPGIYAVRLETAFGARARRLVVLR